MRNIIILLFSIVAFATGCTQDKSIYDFNVKDIDGKEFSFSSLKGKKILIVNVATNCVRTPQYEGLQKLYAKYKEDKNFVVIGFPSNDFNGQEPGTDEEIKEFCSQVYSVTFPMMSKVTVKGENTAPIYKWLTEKSENGRTDGKVISNFQKILIDRDGTIVEFVHPNEDPFTENIVRWIEQ